MMLKLKIIVLSFMLLLGTTVVQASGDHSATPRPVVADEPTVTAEEAKLLQQVGAMTRKDLGKAIAYLKPKIKADSSAALHFASGNIYFQLNRFKEAEAAYRKALEKMGGFKRARANLARILVQQDRLEDAVKELNHLLLAGSPKPSTLTLLGFTYLMKDDVVAAESAYRQAIMFNPDDVNALLGLVKALYEQDRFAEAVKQLDAVIKAYPMRGELWALLANGRMALEQPKKAIAALESSRRLGVITEEGLSTLGDLYLNQNQPEQAMIAYKKAYANDKAINHNRLLRAIDGFLMVKELSYASQLIKRAVALDKADKLTLKQVDKLYWQQARKADLEGNKKKALRAYKKILKRKPLSGKALIALGDLYQQEKSYEQAAMVFERAARLDNVKITALIRLGQLYVERTYYEQAEHYLEQAQLIRPQKHVSDYLEQVKRLIR